MKCQYCRARMQKESIFCTRCGYHTYEAYLIACRDTIKLYFAFSGLFLTLIAYLSN